jgi:mono/diheme cytochrome c family protein
VFSILINKQILNLPPKIPLSMIYSIRTRFKLKIHILLLVFALGITNLFAYEPTSIIDVNDEASLNSIKKGEELYKANCTSCHAIDKKLIGPALKDVWTRWGSEEDLIAWIRNNQAFLATGDPYANALYAEYNQSPMNAFLQFTDADVISIIDYIRANGSGIYPYCNCACRFWRGSCANIWISVHLQPFYGY